MLITILIAILLALAIGVVIPRSLSNKNSALPKQAPSPLRNRLQAKTDIEAALEFEAYKQKKETSVNMLQDEMKEIQRKFEKQYHNDFEKLKSEIQSGVIHSQKENQKHLKKTNENMQDWIKHLLHAQRKELQESYQKTNDKIKQDIQSEIKSTGQQIQREIRIARQFVKEEIQKATLKASPKATPKATVAEKSKEPITENLEKQLNEIEITENQLQTNIFNELNHQLADAQKTMAQIQAQLEMLHLLHALECEFKNQTVSMTE
ncbi:hypothetical protein [Cohnella cholangitidis]|uniref:Uncharacterized protein n=1 Tax=Cohnella cholangitidis TaxID=2598458 RepID=A0A7G5C6D0_9BACL|nr:hypothetical protein [Cohnella cholangitidis]QMV44764.1 hypothetical protein FPL14_29065 [Cohnella cholangitidis]